MHCEIDKHEFLWNSLSEEYRKATEKKFSVKSNPINDKLKIVRIFISSTFRDFHNERNLLVTKVFPKLRGWCANHGLHLVECDLRWGIPTDSTQEETLLTCFKEIEKGRYECNDMNFFLGLVGERYGWIPTDREITDTIRTRYNWIDGSSVTLMEFIHGMIRTLTPNGLVMIRLSNFIEMLPENLKSDFIESDLGTLKNLKLFKIFLDDMFKDKGLVHFYEVKYDGIIYDKFINQERVLLSELEEFGDQIEKHFINCINRNLLPFVKVINATDNMDEVHDFMVECLAKKNTIANETYLRLFESLKDMKVYQNRNSSPIMLLSGAAGMGKSTILAYCAKELTKLENCRTFFHSFSCTSNSMFNTTICERMYKFLSSTKFNGNETIEEKNNKLSALFQNGPNRSDNDVYYVFFDGLDEICNDQTLQWIPNSTSNRIVMTISCLLDKNPQSFYSKLINSVKFIKEVSIEPMNRRELRTMVINYLDCFGKKLDSEQLDKFMAFKNSYNPLWLISACEELRIHGDYASLTKFISSLPSSIFDLNEMVIKRLIRQDTTNVIKTFLELLVLSKCGLWESLIKEMLANKLGFTEPISHSDWLDIAKQLEGFLLVDGRSLPLIKLRHRVMKESIMKELAMEEQHILFLHNEMALFFEKHLNDAGELFFADYMYHLIQSDSRDRLIAFMRSRKSWQFLKNSFLRSKIMLSTRCTNLLPRIPNQKARKLIFCRFCAFKPGDLSMYTINKNSCFFCGNVVFNNNSESINLFPCSFHSKNGGQMANCCLCEEVVKYLEGESVKICHVCQSNTAKDTCGVVIKEKDLLYHQQLEFSKSVHQIHLLI